MKTLTKLFSAVLFTTMVLAAPALALDDGGGGTGGGSSACKTCQRDVGWISGKVTAVCNTANVLFGSGYRGCEVTTMYPGGSQDCRMSNWGSCSADSGGGGGGFIQ